MPNNNSSTTICQWLFYNRTDVVFLGVTLSIYFTLITKKQNYFVYECCQNDINSCGSQKLARDCIIGIAADQTIIVTIIAQDFLLTL